MTKSRQLRLLARSFLTVASSAICAHLAATNISGTIPTSTTWTTAGSPYILSGDVLVEGAGTPVLTIQPGVQVKFNSGASLRIGQGAAGEISAVGSSGSPIVFTANGSTTPGFWQGVMLLSHTTAASQITWATVTYGGNSSYGQIRLAGSPATLTNVTAQSGYLAGISVESGSPQIVTCTLSNNPWGLYVLGGTPTAKTSTQITNNTQGGIFVAYTASPSLQTVTISNNTGYAISQDSRVTLGTVTSLTVSGNTNNAIEIRNVSSLNVTTTWKTVGLPYVISAGATDVDGPSSPVLTIQSGVTVKFAQGTSMLIGNGGQPGGLQANGTSAAPIIFTANATNPSAGYWGGIQFIDKTLSSSSVSYATVSYAGNGIYVQNSIFQASTVWPALQNVTFQSNTTGLVAFKSTPGIINCNFVSNGAGLTNSTPTVNNVTAGLNYWGAASGPSGSGPGTGQSVSSAVIYEPWLLSTPTNPNYLNTFTLKNRTFNPSILVNSTISSGSAQSASWTTNIFNSGGSTVRTYSGTGTTWSVIWDGKDGSGNPQADGTYSYQLQTGTSAIAKGYVVKDSNRQLTVTGYTALPAYFSPNGDGIQDTSTVSGTFSFDDVSWTLRWKNPSNTVVKTFTGAGASISSVWDGKNGASPFPDAPYTAELTATDGLALVIVTAVATLDTTVPTATITIPSSGQTISNVYQSGNSNFTIVGTASDTNVDHWQLDNLGFTTIATGTSSVTNSSLASWTTLPVNNGSYTLKLQVWDKAGNTSSVSVPVVLGNFKLVETALELNGSTGGTVTYKSTVPFNLTETLFVRNASNQTVRTLVNGVLRTPRPETNPYLDAWDGKNGSGALQPDGPYFYIGTVTDGTHSMTWDLSSTYVTGGSGAFVYPGLVAFDPYNNQPRAIAYNWAFTGRVSVGFSTDNQLDSACQPPDFCPVYLKYEESGPHTFYWLGVDSAGQLRSDLTYGVVVKDQTQFPQNAVVLFGTKPAITAVSVTPPTYSPSQGSQTVSYTLATYQNQAVTIKMTFLSQASLSVLRTITLNNVTPGNKTTTWDGKADNGMLVAPGSYLVTVSTTDSIGNQGSGQILTNVVY